MSTERGTSALTEEQVDHILQSMADSFGQQLCSLVMHWPSEQDLEYEDVTFTALDGVQMEGWFIPAAGSDKLIIANHPMGFSRSGIPRTWSRGGRCGRQAATPPRSTSSPITRFCTTLGTTSWPMICATSG